jgi:hypothetical protein
MALTTDTLKSLRADIDAALKAVAAKHGVTLTTGRCSYADTHATFKLEVATTSGDGSGNTMTKQAADFLTYAPLRNWDASLLFKEIPFQGGTATVIGAYPRRKMPIVVRSSKDGKNYVTGEWIVLKKAATAAAG